MLSRYIPCSEHVNSLYLWWYVHTHMYGMPFPIIFTFLSVVLRLLLFRPDHRLTPGFKSHSGCRRRGRKGLWLLGFRRAPDPRPDRDIPHAELGSHAPRPGPFPPATQEDTRNRLLQVAVLGRQRVDQILQVRIRSPTFQQL